MVALVTSVWADQKVTSLTAETSASGDDLLYLVDMAGPTSKKITLTELFGDIAVDIVIDTGKTITLGSTRWDDGSDKIQGASISPGTLVASDEVLGAGWDGDNEPPTKDNVRDWAVLFDTDLDGDLSDESWAPTRNSLNLVELTAEPTEVAGDVYLADGSTWDPFMRSAQSFKYIMENKKPLIRENDLIAGTVTTNPICGSVNQPYTYGWSIWGELNTINKRKLDPFYISEETKKTLHKYVFPFWMDRR